MSSRPPGSPSPEMTSPIRLTQTVQKGGCAAKLPAGTLREVLDSLALPTPPELLVGVSTFDDAALWDLGDGRALVQTLDFFTPVVDDARDFGAIAAANALSDVYAMGGEPKTCMSILAFPTATLPLTLLHDLMGGALEKIRESGAALVGGHTIDDDTLKFGFSVTGFVDRDKAWTNAGAQVGDVLILTKALGTGTLMSALKEDGILPDELAAAIASMRQLNCVRDLLDDLAPEVHAATDITGFGLAGHALQLARASGVGLHFSLLNLPRLLGADRVLAEGYVNRAHRTNQAYTEEASTYAGTATEIDRLLTRDAQTSGGLLLSVSAVHADEIVARLLARFPACRIVGKVTDSAPRTLRFDA